MSPYLSTKVYRGLGTLLRYLHLSLFDFQIALIRERKKIPFASIWLWFHCSWVRWNVLLETSDLLQVVAAPFSKSRWTNSLTEKSLTRFPASPIPLIGISEIEVEIFPRPFLHLGKYFLRVLTLLFCFEAQPPIVTIMFYKPHLQQIHIRCQLQWLIRHSRYNLLVKPKTYSAFQQ